jgi:hypothetical protein
LCTAAVLAGQITLTDITDWVATADQQVLAALGCRRDPAGRATAPHPDTVERVFALLGAQDLADGVGAHLAAQAGIGCVGAPIGAPTMLPAVAVDGKAVRGAIGDDGQVPYLLAAATHGQSAVIAERLVGAKSNEVPEFAPLLRGLAARVAGVGGCVFTMDAGHTVRAHAQLITQELLAHYVMTVIILSLSACVLDVRHGLVRPRGLRGGRGYVRLVQHVDHVGGASAGTTRGDARVSGAVVDGPGRRRHADRTDRAVFGLSDRYRAVPEHGQGVCA